MIYIINKSLNLIYLQADLNGDGVIERQEFIAIMLKTNLYS